METFVKNGSMPNSPRRSPLAARLQAPTVRSTLFFGLAIAVGLMGGSSRADTTSLLVLRPIAFLLLGYALWLASARDIRAIRGPLCLLLALATLIALQLVPLPPALWAMLPGRAEMLPLLNAAGLEDIWRPLSMVPSRTWNTLMAVSCPLAALVIFAIQSGNRHRKVLLTLIALGIVSALLGIAQVSGPDDGPLYLYRQTSNGAPVGLFANRNHQAIFLASLIPLLWVFASGGRAPDVKHARSRRGKAIDRGNLSLFGVICAIALLLVVILATGSRAGAGLAVASMAGTVVLMLWGKHSTASEKPTGKVADRLRQNPALVALPLLLLAALGLTLLFARGASIDRLFAHDVADDLRFAVLPTLFDLARTHFLFGTGFGSFEFVYKGVEPTYLLSGRYLNQAHNDPLQIVIEAGLAGLALILWLLGLLVRRLVTLARNGGAALNETALSAGLALTICLLGSITDYPLRTPLGMVWFAWLCCLFLVPATPVNGNGAE